MSRFVCIVVALVVFVGVVAGDSWLGNCFTKCSVDSDCGTLGSPGCNTCNNGVCGCAAGLEACADTDLDAPRTSVSYGYDFYYCINSTTHTCCGFKDTQRNERQAGSSYVGNKACLKGQKCCFAETFTPEYSSNSYRPHVCYDPATDYCCESAQGGKWGVCPLGSSCLHKDWTENMKCVAPGENFCFCSFPYWTEKVICGLHEKCGCVNASDPNAPALACTPTPLTQCNCPYGTKCIKDAAGVVINCEDIDECAANPKLCTDPNTVCKNTYGNYFCSKIDRCSQEDPLWCKSGTLCGRMRTTYTGGPPYECSDQNECNLNGTTCADGYICNNTYGSYSCIKANCTNGYLSIDDTCKECYLKSVVGPYYFAAPANIALYKPVTSSTVWTADANANNVEYLVNDGGFTYTYKTNSTDNQMWVEIDLLGYYPITRVMVAGGTPYFNLTFLNYQRKVLSTTKIVVVTATNYTFTGSAVVNASIVRLTALSTPLQVKEIEVYTSITALGYLFGGYPNVALSKKASQVDTWENNPSKFGAQFAVDHDINTYQLTFYVAPDVREKSWFLNLGVEHVITGINIVPRQLNPDRFQDHTVYIRNVRNELVAKYYVGQRSLNNFTRVLNPPVVGISVQLVNTYNDWSYYNSDPYYPQNWLHVAEVEVYGYIPYTEAEALTKCITGTTKPLFCPPGFTLGPSSCLDINECVSNSTCVEGRRCRNTVGSFECDAKKYFVKSKLTGFVATANTTLGSNVVVAVQKTTDFDNQLWSFIPGDGGFLQNVGTGHVMDIKNGSPNPNANIIVWTKKLTSNANQQWIFNTTLSTLKSKAANVVLDVQNGSSKANTPIIIYTPKSASTNQNQRFELVEYV